MKRFISAVAFCVALLFLLSAFLFFPVVEAKQDPIQAMLNLPAPPPPNPLVHSSGKKRTDEFYRRDRPPADDAPIEDLIDYWQHQSSDYFGNNFKATVPSPRALERLLGEAGREPDLIGRLIKILPEDRQTADTVKGIYDRLSADPEGNKDDLNNVKEWLRFNSPYFSSDLEKVALKTRDTNDYVDLNTENNVLALTRNNYDVAQPIINRLYSDSSQPVSKVLALWAMYRHALDTDSIGDIERCRAELMRLVEDKNQPDGVRDKANDALTHEKDFPGREDWTISLYEDETLVNMQRYTMLTTLNYYAPTDKYIPKMIALLQRTSNPTVRLAVGRNLLVALTRGNNSPEVDREIVVGLLPCLEDPNWIKDGGVDGIRQAVVRKLADMDVPESVPGLIAILDEKPPKRNYSVSMNRPAVNAMANAAAAAANVAARAANANYGGYTVIGDDLENAYNPLRESAVVAVTRQKDPRAVPSLRRILTDSVEGYQQSNIVRAIFACKGFSTTEELAALEIEAKNLPPQVEDVPTEDETEIGGGDGVGVIREVDTVPLRMSNGTYTNASNTPLQRKPLTAVQIQAILGRELLNATEITDELAHALVDRIEVLNQKDKSLSFALRRMTLKWQNTVINLLLLSDAKRGIADSDTMVRLLAQRKMLREQQSGDAADIKSGVQSAAGLAACIFEDQAEANTLLENGGDEARTSLLACSRLIRLPLDVGKVAANLKSPTPILVTAAERYLESEDSPEARSIILARHPGEAKILGATSAFFANNIRETSSSTLWQLYQSLENLSLYEGWYGSGNDEDIRKIEKRLQNEVKKDADLLGIYAYEKNYVRIYKDRVIYSWEEDDSRYRERSLSPEEFDAIKTYIATNRLDQSPPFLGCGGDYCEARELIMLGKAGGRRVYMNGAPHELFKGIDNYFSDLRRTPGTLKYGLSRDIAGLEVIFASDKLHAETVWKDGADIRMVATEIKETKKAEAEPTDEEIPEESDDGKFDMEKYRQEQRKKAVEIERHRYDGYNWYKIANGEVGGSAVQPTDVEYIPPRDSLSVGAADEQWKARAASFEVRASEEGLFKVVRGRVTKIRDGYYSSVLVTPNGRWALANKFEEERGGVLVRIDLLTNREYNVDIEGYGNKVPIAFVPTLNKVLVIHRYEGEYDGEGTAEPDDTTPEDDSPDQMVLVDPATGRTQQVAGEFRPLSQQTFRGLQKTGTPFEYWAAIPNSDKNETDVGTYEIKTFGFKPVLKIPKIRFNSMDMWVDEVASKVYFVYRGHVLALPLKK